MATSVSQIRKCEKGALVHFPRSCDMYIGFSVLTSGRLVLSITVTVADTRYTLGRMKMCQNEASCIGLGEQIHCG